MTCVTSCVHVFFLYMQKMGNCAQIVWSSLLGFVNSIVAPCREQRDSACTVTFGRTCRPLRELHWIIFVNMHRLKDAKLSQPMTNQMVSKQVKQTCSGILRRFESSRNRTATRQSLVQNCVQPLQLNKPVFFFLNDNQKWFYSEQLILWSMKYKNKF